MIFIQENEDFFDKTADIVLSILDKLANPFLNQYVHVFLPDKRSCRILKDYITKKRYGTALILPKILTPLDNILTKEKLDCILKTMSCLSVECQNFDYATQVFNEYRHIINERFSLEMIENCLINKGMVNILRDIVNVLPTDIFFKDLISYTEYVKNAEIPCIVAGFRRENKYIEEFLHAAYQNNNNKIIFHNSADIYNFQRQMIYNISGKMVDNKNVSKVAKTYITNLSGIYEEMKLVSSVIRQNIGKKILLIYTDKSIVRSVQLYLKKWNIILESSICQPVKESKEGVIISQVVKIFQNNFRLKDIRSLVNFVTNGESCKLEQDIFLSTKIAYDVTDFAKFDLEKCGEVGKKIIQHFMQIFDSYCQVKENFLENCAIFERSVNGILTHIESKNLLDDFWESLHAFADKMNSIDEYFALVDKLLDVYNSSKDVDSTPNILALTPQESLLIKADITIICGFNDSNWMVNNSTFLLNNTKQQVSIFNNLEKDVIYDSINHALKSSKEVYITNSDPLGCCQILSSFLSKEDVQLSIENGNNLIFDERDTSQKAEKPAPNPPLEFRPLTYSATDIEQLANNPYAFYAKKVLKLKSILYTFDSNYKNRLKGIILHEALKLANCENKDVMRQKIEKNINDIMEKYKLDKFYFSDWIFRVPKIAEFASENIEYGQYLEYTGIIDSCLSDNFFVKLKCIADCIQKSGNFITIVDYKTGSLPSMQQIISLEKPQLIVEGVIAKNSGFFGLENLNVQDLKFIRLGCAEKSMNIVSISDKMKNIDMELFLKDGENKLTDLLKRYTLELNSYQASSGKFYDEYGHLARGKEWGTYT